MEISHTPSGASDALFVESLYVGDYGLPGASLKAGAEGPVRGTILSLIAS